MIFWIIYVIVSTLLIAGLFYENKVHNIELSKGALTLAIVITLIPVGNILILAMCCAVIIHEYRLKK